MQSMPRTTHTKRIPQIFHTDLRYAAVKHERNSCIIVFVHCWLPVMRSADVIAKVLKRTFLSPTCKLQSSPFLVRRIPLESVIQINSTLNRRQVCCCHRLEQTM
ncbi:hypothetical protein CDAR_58551 [Caerostris darwini]|uniref:Uncharacterized protein n=1 Tax=Caerostris darwini TaxID=1538125 RepID=A0AAV4U7A4_9ARAC|nr:hypothetical protein CDAR_58551 [Caerostris darwini]